MGAPRATGTNLGPSVAAVCAALVKYSCLAPVTCSCSCLRASTLDLCKSAGGLWRRCGRHLQQHLGRSTTPKLCTLSHAHSDYHGQLYRCKHHRPPERCTGCGIRSKAKLEKSRCAAASGTGIFSCMLYIFLTETEADISQRMCMQMVQGDTAIP